MHESTSGIIFGVTFLAIVYGYVVYMVLFTQFTLRRQRKEQAAEERMENDRDWERIQLLVKHTGVDLPERLKV